MYVCMWYVRVNVYIYIYIYVFSLFGTAAGRTRSGPRPHASSARFASNLLRCACLRVCASCVLCVYIYIYIYRERDIDR